MKSLPRNGVHVAIGLPQPDESTSSLLDRAAAFWGLEREAFLCSLLPDEASVALAAELDAPTPALVDALADTVGADAALVAATALPDDLVHLAPGHRLTYCPLCWEDDAIGLQAPYFRRAWARWDALACERHGTPLLMWFENAQGRRAAPPRPKQGPRRSDEAWLLDIARVRKLAADPEATRVLKVVQQVAAEIAASLTAPANYPIAWRGTAQHCLSLLILLGTNPAPYAEHRAVDRLVPEVAYGLLFSGQRRASPPCEMTLGWEAIRRIASPAVRRTLTWTAAAAVVPDWKPLPIRGWVGPCSDHEGWWHRRIRPTISAHAWAILNELERNLGLEERGRSGDLFAA